MRVKEWEKFRVEAMEAYQSFDEAHSGRRNRNDDQENEFEKIPYFKGEWSCYDMALEGIKVETADPEGAKKQIGQNLAWEIRSVFGADAPAYTKYYLGRYGDFHPLFFVEYSYTHERLRIQFSLKFSVRNKSLVIYPQVAVFQEQYKSEFLKTKAGITIVGTYFVPLLPFGLLAFRFTAPLWRRYINGFTGATINDRSIFNPLSPPNHDENHGLPMHRNDFIQWTRENINDFEKSLQRSIERLRLGSSQMGQRRKTVTAKRDDDSK